MTLLNVLVIGVLGFVQGYRPGNLQRREAKGLILFCWTLIATSSFSSLSHLSSFTDSTPVTVIATLAVASVQWFFTLTEVEDFRKIWLEKDEATHTFLQDKVRFCPLLSLTRYLHEGLASLTDS